MRNKVISFLKKLGNNPEQDYNEGLTLFMQSPNANRSLVRAYNTQGYSAQRLNELVYDLKQAHNIEASEIVADVEVVVLNPIPPANQTVLKVQLPEFAKGVAGNAERKAYLTEHGIVSESFKNADMDTAIAKYLLDKAEAEKIEAGNKILVESAAKMNDSMEVDSEKILKENASFEKVLTVMKANGSIPMSLVKGLYKAPEMTDEQAMQIASEALHVISPEKNIEVKAEEVVKADTNISKNDTDVPESETKVTETETGNPDSEKK